MKHALNNLVSKCAESSKSIWEQLVYTWDAVVKWEGALKIWVYLYPQVANKACRTVFSIA